MMQQMHHAVILWWIVSVVFGAISIGCVALGAFTRDQNTLLSIAIFAFGAALSSIIVGNSKLK